jgi:hypothetical protein
MGKTMIDILDGDLDALISMPSVGKRRHPCSRRVCFYLSTGSREAGWSARSQNISQEGFAVVSNRPFEPGLPLTFEIEFDNSTKLYRLDGHVVHATPVGVNQWLIGCKLSQMLSQLELQRFLDEAWIVNRES